MYKQDMKKRSKGAEKRHERKPMSDESLAESKSLSVMFAKSSKEFQNMRKKQLKQANEEEDKTIKRLEKMLKLNKKKKKCLGDPCLDYLLEALDVKDESNNLSDCCEELEDLAAVKSDDLLSSSKRKAKKHSMLPTSKKMRTLREIKEEKPGKMNPLTEMKKGKGDKKVKISRNEDAARRSFSNDLESDYLYESESNYSDDNEEKEEDKNNSDNKNNSANLNRKKSGKKKVWEDIYGRLRDESGNIIKHENTKDMSAPDKSMNENVYSSEKRNEDCVRIKRQLKALLNKLSESNMKPICNQIEDMYMKNSRNDMNETLFLLISELVLNPVLVQPRFIIEKAMLVALLHANIGSEVGAFFLQRLVQKLHKLFQCSGNYGEDQESNNILLFLSHLYNFKITHATLIFDIFHQLVESFQSKDIELIQLLLKNIGFRLRKDDPLRLKEIILSIQAKAAAINKDENDLRVRYMLETLTAIRNNNMYKIPDYDPNIIQQSKKYLKGIMRKGCSIQELAISFEDLQKADERGRWWIVGSAWSEHNTDNKTEPEDQTCILPKTHISEKILELAQRHHMNTEARKSIFCIIMTAEICLQFSLWDRFKEIAKMKSYQLNNLARLLSHLFTTGALPISVLKVIFILICFHLHHNIYIVCTKESS
ncbi:nucleolar MIF4G domain-containing protein 1-like isoform X2 [Stegodyphus dumicola]|uniref:nucleolar MIF4G domain-containing protein 1-like isoform X2 n=1 Tax=Stegodyphus dumicola TaxID=202533 RepID=UPI0015A888AF|nr:nucleolar MIF4G domain-containing protein 1-like isoform X2 [Stegodyphus dumicola]